MSNQKYQEENLKLVSEMPNYNRWVFNNIEPYLGERILEIGCGVGNITQFLRNKNLVVGVDVNDRGLKELKERFTHQKNFIFLKGDMSKRRNMLKLRIHNFDTVLCLNILEHIRDDRACLKEMNGLLKEEGRIILLCPSYPSLFGTIDKVDGHYRRYSKKDLVTKVDEAGFKIKKVFYMNVLGILGWVLHGRILKRKVHVKSHFKLLNYLSNLLMHLEKIINPPFGLSIIVVGVKKE